MSVTIVKFECDGCGDGVPCTAEYKTLCPEMVKNPTNCLYDDMDGEPEWERVEEVEQSTEGDSMKHVPVIHKKSEVEEKKWEYEAVAIGGLMRIQAVDSKTGDYLSGLFEVGPDGMLMRPGHAKSALLASGHGLQGLQFDDDDRIRLG